MFRILNNLNFHYGVQQEAPPRPPIPTLSQTNPIQTHRFLFLEY